MFRKTILLTSIIFFSSIIYSQDFIEDLIGKMTLEEKVGQMTQINLTVIAKGPNKRPNIK